MQSVRTAPLITLGNGLSIFSTISATIVLIVTTTTFVNELRAEMRMNLATQGQRIDALERETRANAMQGRADREIIWEMRGDIKHLRLMFDKTPPAQPPH